jgi:hydroxymethylglutaryl-CoA synthase
MQKSNTQVIGISDIGVYLPRPTMDLDRLVAARVAGNPRLARHLDRALRTTGQKAIRFPDLWEDTATMAAQAAFELVHRNPKLDLSAVRHLSVGTETSLDLSKPVSAYVQGLLQKAGLKLTEALSSYQVQHACAGATMSLLSVCSMLQVAGRPGETGIVIASDISRYDLESTAEITQGAGAVALLVEQAPRLLELDLASVGFFSRDVDDFFRPLDSKTAKVKGRYSMDCYIESLEGALLDHCQRLNKTPEQVLAESELIMLHTPFRNMPESAMQRLLQRHLGYTNGHTENFLQERGFYQGVDPMAHIGNIYTGSLYLGLAFLLYYRYKELGERIVGKRLLLASYGSGNTMIIQAGQVTPTAPEVLSTWDLDRLLGEGRQATIEEYSNWAAGPHESARFLELAKGVTLPGGSFYLARIRKDGYREYGYTAGLRDWNPQSESPVDLHRSVPLLG